MQRKEREDGGTNDRDIVCAMLRLLPRLQWSLSWLLWLVNIGNLAEEMLRSSSSINPITLLNLCC